MYARGGDLQCVAFLRRHNGAAHPLQAKILQSLHPDAAARREAAQNLLTAQLQGREQLIVPIDDGQTAGTEILEDLRLGPADGLPALEVGQVDVVHIGDYGDVRAHSLPQPADLPGAVHAGLDHRRLVLRQQGQEGQRRADVPIEVARGLEGIVPLAQHPGQQLFKCGLAHAAGDVDNGQVKLPPVPPGQIPQGTAGVLH